MIYRKFQEGGAMVGDPNTMPVAEPMPQEGAMPEEGAPAGAPTDGEDPLMQIVQMFVQGLQSQDCNLLAQGAQMFLELIQQGQGGGQQPVFKRGGRLVRR